MSNKSRDFRSALGKFPTGVTIITTCDRQGRAIGVTASSFNSVSLTPPLVLWSLDRESTNLDHFCAANGFNVHVLGCHQSALSNRFANPNLDKFDGRNWQDPHSPFPLLDDYAALFRCTTRHQYDGGDHIIFVGEVTSFEARDIEPLIYSGGRYQNASDG